MLVRSSDFIALYHILSIYCRLLGLVLYAISLLFFNVFAYSFYCSPFMVERKKLARLQRAYRRAFFLGKQKHKPVDVWVHAVSLGEVIAAIPLIDAMLEKIGPYL